MAFLQVGDLRVHVQQLPASGARRGTVVLVHGLLTDSLASYYFTLGPTFAAAGWDVVMYDQRGHGRTTRPASGYQLERFVRDLEALLAVLDLDEPVHLMGNSFGGTVACGLAERRPDLVASVLFIESEPATELWAQKMAVNLPNAERELPREETIARIAEHYGAHTARLAKAAAKLLVATPLASELPASPWLGDQQLLGITCPVLAIYGADSDMAPQAPWLEAHLPRCRSVFVPGQEHSVLVEATDATREIALAWLAEHAPVGAAR